MGEIRVLSQRDSGASGLLFTALCLDLRKRAARSQHRHQDNAQLWLPL